MCHKNFVTSDLCPATMRQLQRLHEDLAGEATSVHVTNSQVMLQSSASYLHSSFGNGYCLLFHGLMNGYLIPHLHLVEFINATNTLQQKNENK